MTRALATRLKRLERRRASRRPRPAVIITLYGEPLDRIVGVGAIGREPVNRQWGEPLAALAHRARTAVGAPRMMVAAYSAAALADAPLAAPGGAVAAPSPAPEAPPPAPPSDRKIAWAEYRKEKGW